MNSKNSVFAVCVALVTILTPSHGEMTYGIVHVDKAEVSRLFGVTLEDADLLSAHVSETLWHPGSFQMPGFCVAVNSEGRPAHQSGNLRKSMEVTEGAGPFDWRKYAVKRHDYVLGRFDRGEGLKPAYNVIKIVIEGSQTASSYDPLSGWSKAKEIYHGRQSYFDRELSSAGCRALPWPGSARVRAHGPFLKLSFL